MAGNSEALMSRTVKRLLADQSGATAIEYGLICAIISIVLLITFNIGNNLIAVLETLIPALS
jgi:Flp pilus assembly pilin Flp